MAFLTRGRFVLGTSPADPFKKSKRPGIVIDDRGDQVTVAFGQSNPSGMGPYFEIDPTPHSPLFRTTYFYLANFQVVSAADLRVTDFRVSRTGYATINAFCSKHIS